MPTYLYTATSKEGEPVSGSIEAHDRNAAVSLISKQGYRPLVVRQNLKESKISIKFPFLNNIKSRDLVIFTRQLATMVNAGVPLVRSLLTLQTQTASKPLKIVVGSVAKDVESGMSLGDAFANHPNVFSEIYINMVRAGETGGILDEIMNKLADQQEKDAAIRKRVKSASAYPAVLLFITVVAFFALTIFVIPKMSTMIRELGGEDAKLPIQTQIMIATSDLLRTRWYLIISSFVIFTFAIQRWRKTKKGRFYFDLFLLHVPIVKTIVTKVAIARFTRIFASLMGAGVSVLESIEVTAKALGNTVIEKELLGAAEAVKNGKQLSEPIAASVYFPPIVSQMLAVGEETGQTETILVKVADFYEEEVDSLIDGLSAIIEPVMITVMGSMVGLIAASVIGPISSLTQSIK